jgi:hypothetical protein
MHKYLDYDMLFVPNQKEPCMKSSLMSASTPRISVVCIFPDSYETIRQTVFHLKSQTVKDRIELVLVAPAIKAPVINALEASGFASVIPVETGPMYSTAEARALGVQAATTPIVVFTEDHSFPERKWAEALIRTHQQQWAVVGPAVINANPLSLVSCANFLIEYSEWMDPAPRGPARHLPGHNSAYKKALLLRYGDQLGKFLEAESVLHWDLIAGGHQLFLETAAKTRHMNFSLFSPTILLRLQCGRLFGFTRSRHWSPLHRLIYIAGSPMIPFVRLYRILRQLQLPGRRIQRLPKVLSVTLLLLIVDAFAEVIGYSIGAGNASHKMVDLDFHRERFINEDDKLFLSIQAPIL